MKRISRRLTAVSCALALALSLVLPVWAAPVFSDVGEGKWYKLPTSPTPTRRWRRG